MYAESDTYLKGLSDTPKEKEVKAQMGTLLRQLEDKSGPLMEFFLKTREWSLDLMKQILAWLDIDFDRWFFESECDRPSRDLVLEKFKEGFFVKSEGAIGKDLSEYGLGFAMFLKSDGTTLYLSKDLDLIRKKFSDPDLNLSIVVVDNRQSLHFKQVFKTAELMGVRPASDSVHLSYETVTDEHGEPCSSRGKTGFRLEVLSKMLTEKITKDYLEGYRGVWPDAEIEKTARQIALGALKYGFLKVDSNRIIRFVLDEWVQIERRHRPLHSIRPRPLLRDHRQSRTSPERNPDRPSHRTRPRTPPLPRKILQRRLLRRPRIPPLHPLRLPIRSL